MNNIPSDSASWLRGPARSGPTLMEESLTGGYKRPREEARRRTMDGLMGREEPKVLEDEVLPGPSTTSQDVMGENTDQIWPRRRVNDSKGLVGQI